MAIEYLECEVCKSPLQLDSVETIEAYLYENIDTALKFTDILNQLLNSYMIYKCTSCEKLFRYTDEEVLKKRHKVIVDKLLKNIVQIKLVKESFKHRPAYLIYCGKCSGQDGKGSCSYNVFKNCEIKEFPIE